MRKGGYRMKESGIRAILAALGTAISLYCDQMIVPLIVLLLVMVGDYITGMVSAYVNKTLCSRCGIRGILKKLSYLMVVCVGIGVDWILHEAASQIGIEYQGTFAVGLLVTIWLVINELISILENLAKIGVPMPAFLKKIIEKLRVSVEKKAK